jgi:hypothetical protein
MFVDMPINKLTNSLPLLYLPFKKTKRYFKNFPEMKGNKHLYVRFASLPQEVQNILQTTWRHMIHDIFVFFNPETDELLGEVSLNDVTKCLDEKCGDVNKKQLFKWLHIISKTKNWDRNHPVYGKYMIICAFLFHFAVSSVAIKNQFRLFSGKRGKRNRDE